MNTMMILPDVIEVEVVEDIKTGLALFRTIPHMVCLLTTPLPQLFVQLDHSDHSKSPGNRQEWVLQGYSLSTAFRPSEPQSSRFTQSRPLP
jgi:hypothetical protein